MFWLTWFCRRNHGWLLFRHLVKKICFVATKTTVKCPNIAFKRSSGFIITKGKTPFWVVSCFAAVHPPPTNVNAKWHVLEKCQYVIRIRGLHKCKTQTCYSADGLGEARASVWCQKDPSTCFDWSVNRSTSWVTAAPVNLTKRCEQNNLFSLRQHVWPYFLNIFSHSSILLWSSLAFTFF